MNKEEILSKLSEVNSVESVDLSFKSSTFGKDLTIIVHGKFRLHVNDIDFCAYRLETEKFPDRGYVVGLYSLVVEWAKKRLEGF